MKESRRGQVWVWVCVCILITAHAGTLTVRLQAKSAYLPSVKQLQAPMFLSENTNGSVNREAPWGPTVCTLYHSHFSLLSQHTTHRL